MHCRKFSLNFSKGAGRQAPKRKAILEDPSGVGVRVRVDVRLSLSHCDRGLLGALPEGFSPS